MHEGLFVYLVDISTSTHLNLFEIHRFLDDLVVLWQLLPGGQHHEDAADLSSTAVLVVDYQLPQFDHHPGQLRRVGHHRGTRTLLTRTRGWLKGAEEG